MYYWLLESRWGITVGKFITGCKLVDENYQNPSIDTVFIRTICRLIPSPWWLDRPMHDQLSKTFVVSRKKLSDLNKL
ncbi:MAG: RDD family protein [Haliscomenobacter sp.]|nr:RDD family protein [Haliscomenobacter sp.]